MKFLKTILMFSIFNLSFAKIKIEAVANRAKKVNVDLKKYNPQQPVIANKMNIDEVVLSSAKKSSIIWPIEFLNYSSGLNPFKFKIDIFKKTNVKHIPLNIEVKGIIDKINSGYENNTMTFGQIALHVFNENFCFKSSYTDQAKELLLFDTRKDKTYDIFILGKVNVRGQIVFDLGANIKVVSAAKEAIRAFNLYTFTANLFYDFGFPHLLNSKYSVGASYFREIITGNTQAGGVNDVFTISGSSQIGFKKFCDFVFGLNGSLQYKYPTNLGFSAFGFGDIKIVQGVSLHFNVGYEALEKKMIDLLKSVDDFDQLIIDNTDFKGGLFKKEAGFKSELSAHLSYVGLEAIFSLKPTYMFDKITYEVDSSVDGLPIKLVSLKEADFFMDFLVGSSYKISYFKLGANYHFNLDRKIAFKPSHLFDASVQLDKKNFFIALQFNYKSSFYTQNGESGDLIAGYFTFDLKTGFAVKEDLSLAISVLNFTNTVAEYKTGFKIDQIKFKVDLQYNF